MLSLTWNFYLYYALLVACTTYALRRGGPPERIGVTILAIGSVLTVTALWMSAILHGRGHIYRSVEIGVLIVDAMVLIGFLVLALRADRYWPMWIVALQILGMSGHLVKFADPAIIPRAYAFIVAIWSYPMIALLVIGTWRHQRRLSRFRADRSWSRFRLLPLSALP
jgi:hypothetical protein